MPRSATRRLFISSLFNNTFMIQRLYCGPEAEASVRTSSRAAHAFDGYGREVSCKSPPARLLAVTEDVNNHSIPRRSNT